MILYEAGDLKYISLFLYLCNMVSMTSEIYMCELNVYILLEKEFFRIGVLIQISNFLPYTCINIFIECSITLCGRNKRFIMKIVSLLKYQVTSVPHQKYKKEIN